MTWILFSVTGTAMVVLFLLKRMSFASAEVAQKCLRQGALLVDVRTAQEYRSGHLSSAVNIPLDELPQTFPRRVRDKSQVVLVHCLSGTRSEMARRHLQTLGYENVFNLGSYGRAERIVSPARN